MGAATDTRLDRLEITLPEMIRTTVSEAVRVSTLDEQERAWVRMAIEREARREGVQRAIIEKSLAGLVWAGIAAIGTGAWQLVKQWLKQ